MPPLPARDQFFQALQAAIEAGAVTKLTLGKYRGSDTTLRNVFVRPVELKTGPHYAFVWRHATRDVTKNHPRAETQPLLEKLIGQEFLDAHLFTTTHTAQLETKPGGADRLKISPVATSSTPPAAHDRPKSHAIPADAPWLRALGVTNDRGQPREGMSDKFRQIQKFAELLAHLLAEAFPNSGETGAPEGPLRVVDMGSGKGYLTFALASLLRGRATVLGIEARPELVAFCNRTAQENGFGAHLTFAAGSIAETPLDACDVLIALHACDTATDDALARGVSAAARLLVVAPCCQKELRRQLIPPPILAGALRHGIFQERQAEFVTDSLRAQLLECTGYRTKVFEFISTEHTAKNLMIAAIRKNSAAADAETNSLAQRTREFAQFYGIRHQHLAAALGFELSGAST